MWILYMIAAVFAAFNAFMSFDGTLNNAVVGWGVATLLFIKITGENYPSR